MYVIAEVSFPDDDATYEVGADVDASYDYDRRMGCQYDVSEPDVSAPDSTLKLSRLVDTDTLPAGWSAIAEEALVEAYESTVQDAEDSAADYLYDCQRDRDLLGED